MKIELSQPFAVNSKVDEFDVKQMKKVLNRLGYYQPYGTPQKCFHRIKRHNGCSGNRWKKFWKIQGTEITEENITAILILEWMQSFDLSDADIAPRAAALQRIAWLILQRI